MLRSMASGVCGIMSSKITEKFPPAGFEPPIRISLFYTLKPRLQVTVESPVW